MFIDVIPEHSTQRSHNNRQSNKGETLAPAKSRKYIFVEKFICDEAQLTRFRAGSKRNDTQELCNIDYSLTHTQTSHINKNIINIKTLLITWRSRKIANLISRDNVNI